RRRLHRLIAASHGATRGHRFALPAPPAFFPHAHIAAPTVITLSPMLRATFVALLLLAGPAACSHDADQAPAHPQEAPPPLPPSSGTPIGYLLDNASSMSL